MIIIPITVNEKLILYNLVHINKLINLIIIKNSLDLH